MTLCWAIVGICKCCTFCYQLYHVLCRYTVFDALGPSNTIPELLVTTFPTLFTAPVFRPASDALELTVLNFFYENIFHPI